MLLLVWGTSKNSLDGRLRGRAKVSAAYGEELGSGDLSACGVQELLVAGAMAHFETLANRLE